MHDLLAGARAHPERTAILDVRGTVTYAELLGDAATLARRLQAACAMPGDLAETRVAILVAPGREWVTALWAIWLAGGIAVPLSSQHPPAEWAYVLEDADVALLLVDALHASGVQGVADARGLLVLPTSESAAEQPTDSSPHEGASVAPFEAPFEAPSVALDSERRALILYTSGTTGKPKGVVHTHGSLSAQVASLVEAWEWVAADHTLLVLPLHHVHGIVNVVCCALSVGATVTMHARFDADDVWKLLQSRQLTVLHAVPTIWRRLLDWADAADAPGRTQCREALSAMRLLVSGSAALPVSLLERCHALSGQTLLERYGMTEIGMALSNPLHDRRVPGHVGHALPGVEVRAVDERGAPVATGEQGSLEVRGATVMREYWRRPEETAAAFHDGWFRTGDVAVHEVIEGGRSWRLLGRESTDIIKTGGYKVSALEIEEVLRLHDAVGECAVVGVPDDEWGECVGVAVELAHPDAAAGLSLQELRAFAKTRLAVYKVPTRLQVVPALPRNVMGKVVKPTVLALFT